MPALTVVFDTNLYRKLGFEAFKELAAAERELSIRARGSYYVATEFLAHLADYSDPDFGPSLNGLSRLWDHTRTYDGSIYTTNMLSTAEEQVAHVLFPEFCHQIPTRESLGGLVGRVVHAGAGVLPGPFADALAGFRAFVQAGEDSFVDSLLTRVVKTLVPDAQEWYDVTAPTALREQLLHAIGEGKGLHQAAEGFVRRVVETFDFQCSEEMVAERTEAMKKVFPLPLHVVDDLVTSIVTRGLDMTKQKRANSLWDIHIAFSIGTGAIVDGTPLWLITDDEAILSAASAAATTETVKHLDEYREVLESDWCSFRGIVANEPVAP